MADFFTPEDLKERTPLRKLQTKTVHQFPRRWVLQHEKGSVGGGPDEGLLIDQKGYFQILNAEDMAKEVNLAQKDAEFEAKKAEEAKKAAENK